MGRLSHVVTAATGLIACVAFSACSSEVTVSDPARSAGNAALCATGDSTVTSLEAGGATARAAAYVIRDNTTNAQVKKAASLVIANPSDGVARKALQNVIATVC